MARLKCVRCGEMGNTLDPPHLCWDLKKRYERSAKAVAIVADILEKSIGPYLIDDPWERDEVESIAADIVKALAGRDLGDN
jgi:hypothetical protein